MCRTTSTPVRLTTTNHAVRASLALGDLAGARRSADALWELAQQTPDATSGDGQSMLWKANLLRGIIAYAEGEWRIAKVHFRYCDENLTGHRGEWELHAAWAILENEVDHRAEARRRLKAVTGVGDDRDAGRLSMAAFISAFDRAYYREQQGCWMRPSGWAVMFSWHRRRLHPRRGASADLVGRHSGGAWRQGIGAGAV